MKNKKGRKMTDTVAQQPAAVDVIAFAQATNWYPNPILRAGFVARLAHMGVNRKYSKDRPYISHPERVAGRVQTLPTTSEDMAVAAFLHDVLEDVKWVTEEQLRSCFSKHAIDLVVDLTNKSKGSPLPRPARKQMDRDHLRGCCNEVKMIKLIDRIDNLRDMHKAERGFRKIYAEESRALAEAVGDVSSALKAELLECVAEMLAAP